MKIALAVSAILVAFLQCCFGQTDNEILALGEWSVPVSDAQGFTLRGRLRVEETKASPTDRAEARAFLELQNRKDDEKLFQDPIEIYVDAATDLAFEIRDGHNNLISRVGVMSLNSPLRAPFIATLPPGSTLKLPIGHWSAAAPDDPRLILSPVNGPWPLPRGSANDYFLRATFSPPPDKGSALKYHAWQGTLSMKVKLPVDKIKDILGAKS
jgi:hypothetical protein